MEKHFEQAKALIDQSQRILLTMHERMDGDDGGSILALAEHLKDSGKTPVCAIKKGVPMNLFYLPGSKTIIDDIQDETFDLVVYFGCSEKSRCGSEKIIALSAPILNIDHHPDNQNFGQINLVDSKKSSVAEILYNFFIFCNWPITKNIATCLLTGIITDTGSFMHSNTNISTLQIAAQLMSKGASLNLIVKHAYKNKSPKILKAWGKAIENAYYDEKNNIIFSIMAEDDLLELGQLPQTTFEGFTEMLNTLPDARFAMFLKQDGNIIKGSLRSEHFKNIDVSKIAKLFGGGGHKLAAGFSVIGKLIKDEKSKWKIV